MKNRATLNSFEPRHYQQPAPEGCMYYSYAALTGDESLLQYSIESSVQKFLLRVAEKGYLLWPYYPYESQSKLSEGIWEHIQSKCRDSEDRRFLVSFFSPGTVHDRPDHMIAVHANFRDDVFNVYDPGKQDKQIFNLVELDSMPLYGTPEEIFVLDSGDEQDY